MVSWETSDLAELLLPAWDEFVAIAEDVDLDGPSRLSGWRAREVCIHLGSWPGSRTFERVRREAAHTALDTSDPRAGTYDQQSHTEALLDAHADATRSEVIAALREARDEVADFLAGDEPTVLGRRLVRSVLGPLPLTTLVGASVFELAVHALDLEPARASAPSAALLSAGLASLVDTTGGLAARSGLTASAGCRSPEGGWAFSTTTDVPDAWTTVELPDLPDTWSVVEGDAAVLLDASAGRRAVPALLARRELRLHHVGGLLALAPIVEDVPGLPGGPALRTAVRNVRGIGRLIRRFPGLPR